MDPKSFKYDVALSFAGEDRLYVKEVANFLENEGLSIFYDENEQTELWGKDLAEHLREVYGRLAKYCVMFISKHYAMKSWTIHERRVALERALTSREEYILPARFDNTELPGIRSTVAYISLRDLSPREFAEKIIEKVNDKQTFVDASVKAQYRLPKEPPRAFNPYDEALVFMETVRSELNNRAASLEVHGASISIFDREGRSSIRVVSGQKTVYSFDMWMGGFSSDSGLSFYGAQGEIRTGGGYLNAWANLVWDDLNNRTALELHDMSLFGYTPRPEQLLPTSEFIDRLWNSIIAAIERSQS